MARTDDVSVQSVSPDKLTKSVIAVAVARPDPPSGKKTKSTKRSWDQVLDQWAPRMTKKALGLAGDAVGHAWETGAFDAAKGATLLLPAGDNWLLVVGLGDGNGARLDTLRQAGAVTARQALRLDGHRLVSLLHEAPLADTDVNARAEAVVEGVVAGAYRFDRYLKDDEEGGTRGKGQKRLGVTLLVGDTRASRRLRPHVRTAQIGAEGQLMARDLANTPPNVASPEHLAAQARRLARETGLSCRVLGVGELRKKKMTGILAVGSGSANPPRLIVLKHSPAQNRGRTYKRIAVVGKGITFDTGGISIKPSERMELMKFDKSGACAVIALLACVARAKLPLEVIGIAACAENMPSGSAYRPGDILTMMNGKTVEVLNTDAEGRMVLADALHYAGTMEPDAVVDLATLTGAIDIALGSHYAGLMSTDDDLAELLLKAGEATGERLWRMPIGKEYQSQIKGTHSDLVNIGGRSAGALTAAQFLANFAPKDVPWAHLDIAGTAWDDKDRPENRKGASGFGVRLLHRFLGGLV